MAKPDSKSSRDNSTAQKALIAGGVAAAAGAAAFLLARKGNPPDDGAIISDVPAWTLAKASAGEKVSAYPRAPVTMAAFPKTALSQYIQTIWNPAKSTNASRVKT